MFRQMFFVCLSACISRDLGYIKESGTYTYCTSVNRTFGGKGGKKNLLWKNFFGHHNEFCYTFIFISVQLLSASFIPITCLVFLFLLYTLFLSLKSVGRIGYWRRYVGLKRALGLGLPELFSILLYKLFFFC